MRKVRKKIREYLCKIAEKTTGILWGESRAHGESFHDESRVRKSHATIPLKC